jgi:GxxExxY protein
MDLTREINGAAIAVHRELGPGLLEAAYQTCLAWELDQRGIPLERQKAVPLMFKGNRMDAGFRMDLLVADQVVVEVKSVERFEPVHTAQVLTYLKLSGHHLGLWINFNMPFLKDGIRRIVLNLPEPQRPQRPPR